MREIGSQNYVKQFMNHDNYARAITEQLSMIMWSIHTFMVSPGFLLAKFVVVADASIRWKVCLPLSLGWM